MKKMLFMVLAFLLLSLFSVPAFADVFGSGPKDLIKVGQSKPQLTISSEDVSDAVSSLIEKIGAKEGLAYDFKTSTFVNIVSGTFYSYKNEDKAFLNVAADFSLLGTEGVGLGLSYNIGAAIPKADFPLIEYLDYLYFSGGGAYDLNSYYLRPYIALNYKFNF